MRRTSRASCSVRSWRGAHVLGDCELHQLLGQQPYAVAQKSASSTPALRSTLASANLNSSAIGCGSSHRGSRNRDENHPVAVRVNGPDFYTVLGSAPSEASSIQEVQFLPPPRPSQPAAIESCVV